MNSTIAAGNGPQSFVYSVSPLPSMKRIIKSASCRNPHPLRTMRVKYTRAILASLVVGPLLLLVTTTTSNLQLVEADDSPEVYETITFKDSDGVEHEEFAFRAPMKAYRDHIMNMYCANIKLRLYWNVYREEVKSNVRTAMHLRRLARFARHLYKDVRAVDKPFEGVQLSVVDEWYGVKLTEEDQKDLEHATKDDNSSTTISTIHKVKGLVKKYAPTVLVGVYTRWRTMWWLMMSCLFAKYYLWDPALDEFIKLQRSMIMYPEFQLVKLQEIDCLPIKFFQRLLDTCKVLNPLMNIDFGQLNLDKMWQFKGDRSEQ